MKSNIHSVELDTDKCIGCTDCIKRCPTEAIRVRDGKAMIIEQKCIDCGLCIKVCENHAKKATTQGMSMIKDFKYTVAIPAPALYGQFKKITDVNVILTAIKKLGFDEVYEVSYAAQLVTAATKEFLQSRQYKKPVISSACPAVVRLIAMRFPSLIDNILPLMAPVEVAARLAKDHLTEKFASEGLKREDIGVFFISPCAAKNSYVSSPLGVEKSEIDGVISMSEVYLLLRHKVNHLETVENLIQCKKEGMDWAITGGESKGVELENAIAVDGVENVIAVLEEVENGQLSDMEFIEGLACTGGCVGGPLTTTNSFVSKNRIRRIESIIKTMDEDKKRKIDFNEEGLDYNFTEPIRPLTALKLDEDMQLALKKLEEMERLVEGLPAINCGSCGAPTCQALAEDIVRGQANIEDCVFMLRKKVKQLAEDMVNLSAKLPQTIAKVK